MFNNSKWGMNFGGHGCGCNEKEFVHEVPQE